MLFLRRKLYVDVTNGGSHPDEGPLNWRLIKAAEGSYSRVYSFRYYNPEREATYLQIFTKKSCDKPLEILVERVVFVGEQAVPAGSAGDNLLYKNGEGAEIVNIKSGSRNKGAYYNMLPLPNLDPLSLMALLHPTTFPWSTDTGYLSIYWRRQPMIVGY